MNSGAKIFLFILIGCVAVLTITLVLIGVLSKGKKIKGGLKFLVVLLSLMTASSFITFPLAYHNYIDVNVRFGYFKAVDEQSHCWAHTLRKQELKETHVPQCSSQHCL